MTKFFQVIIGVKKYKLNKATTFLIVEDQKDVQLALGKDLRRIGFTGDIYTCDRTKVAMSTIQEIKVDIVFLDLNLKAGDKGIDLLKKLKKYKIPVLIMSAEDSVNTIIQAIDEGAKEFIIKPWDRETLVKKLSYSMSA